MAYNSDWKCCGTCAYWTGQRTFAAFDTVEFDHYAPGDCARPGAARVTGGYRSNCGSCQFWRFVLGGK